MKKRFTEEQILDLLKQAEAGVPVKELCRRHGFSDASFYTWRAKFGGMTVADAKRLKDLELENSRLKKLLAEAHLDIESLKVVARGKEARQHGGRRCRRCGREPASPSVVPVS